MKQNLSFAAFIITIGIITSSLILAYSWQQQLESKQTLRITGSAKKDIVSDLAILSWSVSYTALTANEAYEGLQASLPIIRAFLEEHGLGEDPIEAQPETSSALFEYNDRGFQTGNVLSHTYFQRFSLTSQNIDRVTELALKMGSLVSQGVNISIEQPQYLYSNLSAVRIEAQELAARDAMVRAARVAEATNSRLGPVISARMGVIQITPKNSTTISDYGINDTSSIEKEITAVVSAEFQIR